MSASQIVAMWTSGQHGSKEIARAVGVAQSTVHKTLKREGVLHHPVAREGVRIRRASAARKSGNLRGVKSPGRPLAWPDCPPHLIEHYRILCRKGFRAAEARAMLEAKT
jgi:hypothetical protein